MIKDGGLYRIACGQYYIDIPEEERIKTAIAIEKRLYYKNESLLVRSDGSVFLFLGEDRIPVREPHKLLIFLRC